MTDTERNPNGKPGLDIDQFADRMAQGEFIVGGDAIDQGADTIGAQEDHEYNDDIRESKSSDSGDQEDEDFLEEDLGDDLEDEDDYEEDTGEPDEEAYEVKVRGQTERVSLQELQDGYLRQQDYSRRSNQLRDKEIDLDREVEQAQATKAQYVQGLQQLEELLRSGEPDWDALAKESPEDFAIEKHNWDQKQKTADEVRKRRESEMAAAYQEAAQKNFKELVRYVPELSDPKVFEERQKGFMRFVTDQYGFQDAEAGNWIDHRVIRMALDAQKYHDLQKKRRKAKADGKKDPIARKRPRGPVDSRGRVNAGKRKKGQKEQVRRDIETAKNQGDERGMLEAASTLVKQVGTTQIR